MAKAIGPMTKSGTFRSKSKRRSSRKKASGPKMIQTVQRTVTPIPDLSRDGFYIQLDKILSESNYKMYRQGMNYHAKLTLSQKAETGANKYSIYTLPTDHRTIGALRMARAIYNQAVKDELEIRPEVKTPWTDFKIELYGPGVDTSADDMYTNEARGKRLIPDYLGVNQVAFLRNDSYEISEITSNAGDQKRFSLLDDNDTTHWNVFLEYQNYLTNRADPDSASETPAYPDASAVLTEMAELADKGDEPPYAWDFTQETSAGVNYTVSQLNLQLAGVLSGDNFPKGIQQMFVEAPLGLIFIKCSVAMSNTNVEVLVEALPGNYKGVKADRLYAKDKLLGF